MAKGYINWKLAIVLVVAVCVCVGAALVLHNWQKSSRAEQARPLGLKAYDQQNWAEAAKQLGRYLVVRGDDVDILLKYGHAQRQIRPLRTNNIDQAISAYSTVLRIGKANADQRYEATRWYVEISIGRRQFADAATRAAKYLDGKDDPLLRQRLGYALAMQGKTQEAADVLRALVADHPEHVGAYGLLSNVTSLRPEDFNEPPEYWYERMIKANPESARAHIEYGRFLLGQTEDSSLRAEAEAHFAKAENLDLSDMGVHLELIDILISLRQFDKAREHIMAVKAETPKNDRLWSLWAKLAIRSQSIDEMEEVAEEGLKELSKQPWDFMLWATELFIRTEQFEKAGQCIVKLQKVDYEGYRPRINFLEGFLAARQKKWREATDSYEKAIALGYQSSSDHQWRRELPMVRMVLAEAYERLGDTSRAIAQLRSYISDTPDRPMAHLRLGALLSKEEEWVDVLHQARETQRLLPERGAIEERVAAINLEIKALGGLQGDTEETQVAVKSQTWNDIKDRLAQLDESPDKSPAASRQIEICRVELALATGDHDEALAVLDELDAERPDELAMVVARLLHAPPREDWSRRESFLEAAVERIKDPEVRKALGLRLAQLCRQANQKDRQYELLLELAEQFPDDVTIKQNLLATDRIRRNTEQAQQVVDKIKSIEGEEGRIWRIEQVKVWMASSDFLSHYTETVRLLQENIRSNPDDLTSRRLLAGAYGVKGEHQLAAKLWKEALERASQDSPDYGLILAGTINALQQAGRDDEANQLLAQVKQLDGPSLELPILKLQEYKADGDWSSASDLLSEMVQKDPNNLELVRELAGAYKKQAMFEEARRILDAFIVRNPDAAAAWIEMADLYTHPGNRSAEEALNVCDAFVQQQGTDMAYLLRAKTCEAFGFYDRALANYDRTVSLSPENAGSWLERARFRRSRGQISEGVEDIQKALELDSDNAEIQVEAARLFALSGDTQLIERAKGLLDRTIASNPGDIQLKMIKALALKEENTPASIEQARTLLEETIREDSSFLDAWVVLIDLEFDQKKYDKAIKIASEGLSSHPDNRVLLSRKVMGEINNEDWPAAVSTLETLLDEDPNNPDTIGRLAAVYVKTSRVQDALDLVKRRLPVLTEASRLRLGAILASISIEEMQRPLEENSSPVTTWMDLVALQLALGQYEKAVEVASNGLSKHPNDRTLLSQKAQAEVGNQNWPAAKLTLEALFDEDPNDPDTIGRLASAYVQTNQVEDALDMVKGRRPLLTGEARRRVELIFGSVLYASGDVDRAGVEFERLIAEDPNDPAPVLIWADLLVGGKQWDRVGALVERWRTLHPNDADVPTSVALSLIAAGSPVASQKGEEIARTVLESHPKHLTALRALANAMIRSSSPGDQEEAAQLNRRILQIDPSSLVAMNNLAWVLSETMGQNQEALDLVNRGLEKDPRYADMLDTRGVIHLRMGQFEQAERDLARCVGLYEANAPGAASLPAARLHLAKAYARLGRETEATQQLRQALDAQEKARQADPPEVPPMSDEDEAEAEQLLNSLAGDVDG